jgi:hypothetical protein
MIEELASIEKRMTIVANPNRVIADVTADGDNFLIFRFGIRSDNSTISLAPAIENIGIKGIK